MAFAVPARSALPSQIVGIIIDGQGHLPQRTMECGNRKVTASFNDPERRHAKRNRGEFDLRAPAGALDQDLIGSRRDGKETIAIRSSCLKCTFAVRMLSGGDFMAENRTNTHAFGIVTCCRVNCAHFQLSEFFALGTAFLKREEYSKIKDFLANPISAATAAVYG